MLVPYKSDYRQELVDIFFNVYYYAPFNYTWLEKSNVERYFKDLESTPNFCGFMFVDENTVKGGCFGVINDYFRTPKYRINEIFISNREQGNGFGKSFLRDIEENLKQRDIEIIELYTETSIPAFRFYQNNGFHKSEAMAYMLKGIIK